MDFTLTFMRVFFFAIGLALPLLFSMAALVMSLGLLVGRRERWSWYDSLYWSFITATTVGFGDFRPVTKISKLFSVMIAFIGLVFTGIMVSIAVEATSYSFQKHSNVEDIKQEFKQLK